MASLLGAGSTVSGGLGGLGMGGLPAMSGMAGMMGMAAAGAGGGRTGAGFDMSNPVMAQLMLQQVSSQ